MTGLLQDQVAFVTGAGSGIGQAGALAMARAGAIVIVTDRDGERAGAVAGLEERRSGAVDDIDGLKCHDFSLVAVDD